MLSPGDQVLIRQMTDSKGHGKIKSFWNPEPYIVVKRLGDDGSSVYELQSLSGNKRKVLHRNLMLPCNDLRVKPEQAVERPQSRVGHPHSVPRTIESSRSTHDSASAIGRFDHEVSSDSSSDSDTEQSQTQLIRQPRSRKTPKVFSYDSLGQPSYHRAKVRQNSAVNHLYFWVNPPGTKQKTVMEDC